MKRKLFYVIIILLFALTVGIILGAKNKAPSTEELEADNKAWEKASKELIQKYSDKNSLVSVHGIKGNPTKIIKTELVPIDELIEREKRGEATGTRFLDKDVWSEEELELAKGKYELRIYYDDGDMDATGPVTGMPKEIKLHKVNILSKERSAVVIVE